MGTNENKNINKQEMLDKLKSMAFNVGYYQSIDNNNVLNTFIIKCIKVGITGGECCKIWSDNVDIGAIEGQRAFNEVITIDITDTVLS